jgi:hypothetical protein
MTKIPPVLVSAIREQRAVLFFGSGANHGATHPQSQKIPLGNGLRDLISDKFFGGALKDKPLTAVAAMASNEAGLTSVQRYIYDLFEPFQPANYHAQLADFRWRAIASTNYDLIIERAYESASKPLQKLVLAVKDEDQLDIRLNSTTNPLPYFKLHGSIDHYMDESIPLILSNEQYASYEENRRRMWSRFRDLGYEYHVIFIGYSISDPHVQSILFDLTSKKVGRPMFYSVGPNIDAIESRYWATHRVQCIDATFAEFLSELEVAIPPLARAIAPGVGGGTLSIRSHYKVASAQESSDLATYLAEDVTHVFSGMVAAPQEPKEFYRGSDTGWGAIQQNLDAKRTFSDSVLVDAVLISEDPSRPSELFVLKGPAGNGKTVALKRIAWEAANNYEQLVLYVNGASGLRIDALEEIFRLTGKRLVLCIDHVSLYRNELSGLIKDSRTRGVPLTVLCAERDNEWFTYCDQLEPFVKQEFPVRYLNEHEIDELLILLERHGALGLLKELDVGARKNAFTETAERQLLVALHEATLGVSFEDIIFDEFSRIEPKTARDIYLSICALHQFGAPVRAGLISRASGIGFEQFGRDFLDPLKNIVLVINDRHSGDIFYKSRHQHVAEMVFRRAISNAEGKFDLLADLISAINVSYSSDRETFSRLIKGRGIAEIFASAELGRLFYDRVQQASPDDPFVFHQRAVFEMNHAGGSLVLAEGAAKKAFDLNPHNRGIRHTQGEIARRMANSTEDPLKREALRKVTREKISGDLSRMSEYDIYTRARLAVDELKDTIEKSNVSGEDVSRRVSEAVHDAETTIQRGLQSFPQSGELLSAESQFRDVLNQSNLAQAALEKAFRLNPRQDWLAARLARRYEDGGEPAKGLNVLDQCLKENPSSKTARFTKARILLNTRGDPKDILENLKRSFSEGDNNYEAQFWYARELFVQGDYPTSKRMFETINDRAPGRFRNIAGARLDEANGAGANYRGQLERLEESYAFVRVAHFPNAVFASRGDSDPTEWAALRTGVSVNFHLSFARRGPKAVSVRKI